MFDIQNTDGICLHKLKHIGAGDYVGIKGMLDMDVLERPGSLEGDMCLVINGKEVQVVFIRPVSE